MGLPRQDVNDNFVFLLYLYEPHPSSLIIDRVLVLVLIWR